MFTRALSYRELDPGCAPFPPLAGGKRSIEPRIRKGAVVPRDQWRFAWMNWKRAVERWHKVRKEVTERLFEVNPLKYILVGSG